MIPYKSSEETKLLGIFSSKKHSVIPSKLFILSPSGVIEKEKILPQGLYRYMFKLSDNKFALHEISRGEVHVFNTVLEQIDSYKIDPFASVNYYDIDVDGEKEWLEFHADNQNVSIYRNGFKNQVTFQFSTSIDGILKSGLKQISATENQLYFQKGNVIRLFSYIENPIYLFRYLIYLGVYAAILGLVLLIAKGQKIRLEKQQAIANKISELQIKTIKNQVDPHFVFNAINTISEMTLMDNKLEADRFISHFSKFMRNTLMHSDKISTTLKEELEYVENFIKLQRIRYSNQFNYKITINKNVDLKTIVPKHVLFTYVENAIKHGLSLKKDGLLQIVVKIKKETLFLSVEDNGVGMRPTQYNKKNSTGSGLLIMEQIYKLYAKLHKSKISHRLVELTDNENNKVGLRIEVVIENKK